MRERRVRSRGGLVCQIEAERGTDPCSTDTAARLDISMNAIEGQKSQTGYFDSRGSVPAP